MQCEMSDAMLKSFRSRIVRSVISALCNEISCIDMDKGRLTKKQSLLLIIGTKGLTTFPVLRSRCDLHPSVSLFIGEGWRLLVDKVLP